MSKWNEVHNDNVRHIWTGPDGSSNAGEEFSYSPDWYEDNGTPMTDDGEDMVFLRTETKENESLVIQKEYEGNVVVLGVVRWDKPHPTIPIKKLLNDLWEEWQVECPCPDTDEEFIDYLVEEKGWTRVEDNREYITL